MATGRTHIKHTRFYMAGYDLSGHAHTFGPLLWDYNETSPLAALDDEVKGVLPEHASLGVGTLNGFFDNTATSGLHIVASGAGVKRVVMAPIGIRAAPAAGDPVYCGEFEQLGYQAETAGFVTATIPFGQTNTEGAILGLYSQPWGHLIHANAAATAANTTTGGGGDHDYGAQTALGGYLCYQVFAGDGTATISIDDSSDDSSYAALTNATSGELDCSAVQSGIVALGVTDTVERYLRWQISLNTANTVTFALAFIRGR